MDIKTNILLVEDDYNFGNVIRKNLREFGNEVDHVANGQLAIDRFNNNMYDLILLDIVIPKKNGYEVAEYIRKKNDKIPIIFLTSKSKEEDKIKGYMSGGDAFVTKPFSMQELVLRIDVWLKRTRKLHTEKAPPVYIGNLLFEYGELRLTDFHGNTLTILTQKEADLFKFLLDNPNRVLKREEMLFHIWGKDDYFSGRSMDVFITKIRKHISIIHGVELHTHHGVGFEFVMPC